MSSAKVAGWLRGVLARFPRATQVGVIGHSGHVKTLLNDGKLEDSTRRRIRKWSYFGAGDDRASNDWLGCDLVVVLGTPRVGPADIRLRLLRQCQQDAAFRDGRWGARHWEAKMVSGKVVVVDGMGYADTDWAAAHRDQTAAALVQAVGRGRSVTENGVPVVVVTNEPIGLTVIEPGSIRPLNRQLQAAVEAVRHYCGIATYIHVGTPHEWNVTSEGVLTTVIAAKLRLSAPQTSRILRDAAAAGLVVRCQGHKAGWRPVLSELITPMSDDFVDDESSNTSTEAHSAAEIAESTFDTACAEDILTTTPVEVAYMINPGTVEPTGTTTLLPHFRENF